MSAGNSAIAYRQIAKRNLKPVFSREILNPEPDIVQQSFQCPRQGTEIRNRSCNSRQRSFIAHYFGKRSGICAPRVRFRRYLQSYSMQRAGLQRVGIVLVQRLSGGGTRAYPRATAGFFDNDYSLDEEGGAQQRT